MFRNEFDLYALAPEDYDYAGIVQAAEVVVELSSEVFEIAKAAGNNAFVAVGSFAHNTAIVSSDVARAVGTSIATGVAVAGQAVTNTLTNSWRNLTRRSNMRFKADNNVELTDVADFSQANNHDNESSSSSASIRFIKSDSASMHSNETQSSYFPSQPVVNGNPQIQ